MFLIGMSYGGGAKFHPPSKILDNTPNYLKIGTHVQNYKNNRNLPKKNSIFDFSHLFSWSLAFEGPISAKFQMAIKSEQIFLGRRLTPQMKDIDEYFHIKQTEKSYLS